MARSPTVPVALDRASGVPLAGQLAAGVRDRVVAGTLPVGERLPEHPGAGGRPRRLAQRHRAGLRPADRRGLAGEPARLGDLRRGRRRAAPAAPPLVAATRPDSGCSGSTPGRRGSTRATGRPGAAPGATSRRRPLPRRTTTRRACRELRVELAGHLARTRGLHLRPRRDPGDHRDDRRARPRCSRRCRPATSRTRTPATGRPPRRSCAAGRAIRDLPAAEPVTDLDGVRRGVRHARPPAPARPGDVRRGPALAARRGTRAPARW